MIDASRLRQILRPHDTMALGCAKCAFFEDCGGLDVDGAQFTCFELCDGQCNKCDNVCPKSPLFYEQMREVNGLRFDNLPRITQRPAELPVYIPHIHHGSSRSGYLDWPVVALDTYQLFRGGRDEESYRLVNGSPAEIRRRFGLSATTRIVLRGTATDKKLETYWAHRNRDRAAEQLANLNALLAIGPNFSHFLNVPRTDNLFNRKRQLICLGEMTDAGLSVVPHLSATRPADWRFWKAFLIEHPSIQQVAVELQTGNKNRKQGINVLERLASIQDSLSHTLHPIVIGGAQFIEHIATKFQRFSLIDSRPFMNAVYRYAFSVEEDRRRRYWHSTPMPRMQSIDRLLENNIGGYSDWVMERVRRARSARTQRVSQSSSGTRTPPRRRRRPRIQRTPTVGKTLFDL